MQSGAQGQYYHHQEQKQLQKQPQPHQAGVVESIGGIPKSTKSPPQKEHQASAGQHRNSSSTKNDISNTSSTLATNCSSGTNSTSRNTTSISASISSSTTSNRSSSSSSGGSSRGSTRSSTRRQCVLGRGAWASLKRCRVQQPPPEGLPCISKPTGKGSMAPVEGRTAHGGCPYEPWPRSPSTEAAGGASRMCHGMKERSRSLPVPGEQKVHNESPAAPAKGSSENRARGPAYPEAEGSIASCRGEVEGSLADACSTPSPGESRVQVGQRLSGPPMGGQYPKGAHELARAGEYASWWWAGGAPEAMPQGVTGAETGVHQVHRASRDGSGAHVNVQKQGFDTEAHVRLQGGDSGVHVGTPEGDSGAHVCRGGRDREAHAGVPGGIGTGAHKLKRRSSLGTVLGEIREGGCVTDFKGEAVTRRLSLGIHIGRNGLTEGVPLGSGSHNTLGSTANRPVDGSADNRVDSIIRLIRRQSTGGIEPLPGKKALGLRERGGSGSWIAAIHEQVLQRGKARLARSREGSGAHTAGIEMLALEREREKKLPEVEGQKARTFPGMEVEMPRSKQLLLLVWGLLMAAAVLFGSLLLGAATSAAGTQGASRFSIHVTLVAVAMVFGIMLALCCLGAMWLVSERLEASKDLLLEELGALRECEEGLRHAKKEFLGSVSHEIRTPLNGIIGMLQYLIDEGALGEEEQEALDTALVSCWSLVDWLATFTYSEMGVPLASQQGRAATQGVHGACQEGHTQGVSPAKVQGHMEGGAQCVPGACQGGYPQGVPPAKLQGHIEGGTQGVPLVSQQGHTKVGTDEAAPRLMRAQPQVAPAARWRSTSAASSDRLGHLHVRAPPHVHLPGPVHFHRHSTARTPASGRLRVVAHVQGQGQGQGREHTMRTAVGQQRFPIPEEPGGIAERGTESEKGTDSHIGAGSGNPTGAGAHTGPTGSVHRRRANIRRRDGPQAHRRGPSGPLGTVLGTIEPWSGPALTWAAQNSAVSLWDGQAHTGKAVDLVNGVPGLEGALGSGCAVQEAGSQPSRLRLRPRAVRTRRAGGSIRDLRRSLGFPGAHPEDEAEAETALERHTLMDANHMQRPGSVHSDTQGASSPAYSDTQEGPGPASSNIHMGTNLVLGRTAPSEKRGGVSLGRGRGGVTKAYSDTLWREASNGDTLRAEIPYCDNLPSGALYSDTHTQVQEKGQGPLGHELAALLQPFPVSRCSSILHTLTQSHTGGETLLRLSASGTGAPPAHQWGPRSLRGRLMTSPCRCAHRSPPPMSCYRSLPRLWRAAQECQRASCQGEGLASCQGEGMGPSSLLGKDPQATSGVPPALSAAVVAGAGCTGGGHVLSTVHPAPGPLTGAGGATACGALDVPQSAVRRRWQERVARRRGRGLKRAQGGSAGAGHGVPGARSEHLRAVDLGTADAGLKRAVTLNVGGLAGGLCSARSVEAGSVGAGTGEAHPVEEHPGEAHPVEAQPVAAHPVEAQPEEAHPVEAHPVEAHPVEAHLVEAHPVEAQPVDAQPVEAQPVEAQPVEAQPVEAQPVEAWRSGVERVGVDGAGGPESCGSGAVRVEEGVSEGCSSQEASPSQGRGSRASTSELRNPGTSETGSAQASPVTGKDREHATLQATWQVREGAGPPEALPASSQRHLPAEDMSASDTSAAAGCGPADEGHQAPVPTEEGTDGLGVSCQTVQEPRNQVPAPAVPGTPPTLGSPTVPGTPFTPGAPTAYRSPKRSLELPALPGQGPRETEKFGAVAFGSPEKYLLISAARQGSPARGSGSPARGQGSPAWVQGSPGRVQGSPARGRGSPARGRGLLGDLPEGILERLKGKKALVVDDNAVNRRVLVAKLRRYGLEALQSADGKEALEIFEKAWEEPLVCVFMDLQMPLMDGYESTKEIRTLEIKRKAQGGSLLPVFAVTADVVTGTQERCLSAGMNGLLTKPLSEKELKAALVTVAEKIPDR